MEHNHLAREEGRLGIIDPEIQSSEGCRGLAAFISVHFLGCPSCVLSLPFHGFYSAYLALLETWPHSETS